MFFDAIPRFTFNEENIQSHALNIKKLSEWIGFKECHLGLSRCRELTAIAFGFKTEADLRKHLDSVKFESLSLSETIEADLADAIQRFAVPIGFMSLTDEIIKEHYGSFQIDALVEKEADSDLKICQDFWRDWHRYFAIFLTKYFKETHNNFSWFDSLGFIALTCDYENDLVLSYSQNPKLSFLEIILFNHLITQYVGDYANLEGYTKHTLYDNHVDVRTYIISESLCEYLNQNYQNIPFLMNNLHDSKRGLVTEYDPKNQKAKLNLMLCKSHLGEARHCPVNYIGGWGFGLDRPELRSMEFGLGDYLKGFQFTLPFLEDSGFMNQLDLLEGVTFTQDDFVGAKVGFSFLLQKLLEHSSFGGITNTSAAEFLFDIKWHDGDYFDVTENSFKSNEVFKADYSFQKCIGEPVHQLNNGYVELLQPIMKVTVSSHVYATVEISIKDSKISIDFKDVKTKLASVLGRTPVKLNVYSIGLDTKNIIKYKDESKKLMISALHSRSSFKKMLDAHIFIGPYKQFIMKNYLAHIYMSHQHASLYEATPDET